MPWIFLSSLSRGLFTYSLFIFSLLLHWHFKISQANVFLEITQFGSAYVFSMTIYKLNTLVVRVYSGAFFFSVTLIKIFILCILHIIANIELNFLIKNDGHLIFLMWRNNCSVCSIEHLDIFYENIKVKTWINVHLS